jgi:hypothetical protein
MMRLSVKIMAHKKRARHIPGLLERLGLTDADVIWDRRNDRWDTGRRAWEAVDQTADFGCVLQDDAVVPLDFIAGMEKALTFLPEKALVSPYTGTRRPAASRVERAVNEARKAGVSWIRMPSLNWGVGIIAPTDIIDRMLPWCDKQTYPNYDRRIGRYAIDVLRIPTWCTWPSLVDHRDDDSLVGHGQGRKAHQFLGEEVSALSVKWDSSYVDLSPKTVVGRRFPKRPVASALKVQPPEEISGVRNARVASNRQKPSASLRVPRVGSKPDVPPKRPS